MANIILQNLENSKVTVTGADLFNDVESFIHDLSDD